MATNPMQRKARNSFLLGMLLTTLILGAVIALLFMQLMQKNKEEKEELATSVQVYVLKQDVKNSAYEIAGVPLATANTSSGITGTAQKSGGGWENAEIKMNGRIVGMQKSDYSILKCLIEVSMMGLVAAKRKEMKFNKC